MGVAEALEVSEEARRTLEGVGECAHLAAAYRHACADRPAGRARHGQPAHRPGSRARAARRCCCGGIALPRAVCGALLQDAPGSRASGVDLGGQGEADRRRRRRRRGRGPRPTGARGRWRRRRASVRATVQRIWDAHGLQPHRVETFKLSRDHAFVEKLRDVVGVYLNPPDKAVVLCVDEKSQIQALDRTQPGLPLKKGRCGTMTHDYKRNGTTTLFAALNALEGTVIGTCYPRHRNIEFRKFLRQTRSRASRRSCDIHLILDNYGTHKHPKRAELARQASALSPALHPDLRVVAQLGRALVSQPHRQAHSPRQLRPVSGPDCRHHRVHRCQQRRSEALRLDGQSSRRSWRRSVVVKLFSRHYTSASPRRREAAVVASRAGAERPRHIAAGTRAE